MRLNDKRMIWGALAVLVLLAGIGFGLSTRSTVKSDRGAATAEASTQQKERLQEACASPSTYARLKEVVFEEAIRVRNADPANLDRLAAHSVVRMENPVVKSRDEDLNVTVCTGRFVLELPPGAEAGVGGQRRLVADIEYAAQAAADRSGLVYQLNGAEPIIYRLATFDLRNQPKRAPAEQPIELAEAPKAPSAPAVPPEPDEPDEPAPPPPPRPEPRIERPQPPAPPPPPPVRDAEVRTATARPSFNCRSARTRSERAVCGSSSLAAADRQMSSLFYSALANADPRTRAELRRTRDRFLAYRERCGSDACIAEAYQGRMAEIRDIAAGRY
jgi:uncharacterized protein YecT (DUF1311 family)